VGSPAPAVTLPAGWVGTGEDCCDNSGSDGTVNGILNLGTVTANITNANFGIERLPESNNFTAAGQNNPGGTNTVTLPAAYFGGSDPDGGIVTAIRITAFPTNATSITINGVLYTTLAAIQLAYPNGIPTNVSGQPTIPIAIDPVDGLVTVNIPYVTIDNAGLEDPTPGSVAIPFITTLPITFIWFTAEQTPAGTLLRFTTGEPATGSVFEVQRSNDGFRFTTIATLYGNAQTNYEYLDVAAFNVNGYYYRIRETGLSGQVIYSAVKWADLSRQAAINLFPNPARERITLQLPPGLAGKPIDIMITDSKGNRVFAKQAGAGIAQVQLVTAGWAQGLYLVQMQAGAEIPYRIKLLVTQ
jgi:Secretion system C-terminal sorting domain